jgi:YggT family protein
MRPLAAPLPCSALHAPHRRPGDRHRVHAVAAKPRVDAGAASRLSQGGGHGAGCPAAIHPPTIESEFQMMNPFLWLIHTLIWAYIYILIATAVMSWLIAFNVVNSYNPTVRMIWDFLLRITEPVLAPIRAVTPNLGGIDISPVILIIGLMFLDQLILWIFVSLFG